VYPPGLQIGYFRPATGLATGPRPAVDTLALERP
jgi:hypothetical protein